MTNSLQNTRTWLALEAARAESERTAARARFIAELSAAFATSLDPVDVVERVCHYAIPELADCAIVDLVDGTVERLARDESGADGALAARLRRMRALDPGDADSAVARALREKTDVLVFDVSAAGEVGAPREVDGAPSNAVLASALVLPLVASERIVGAMTLVLGGERTFDESRRTLAEEVARRTAAALESGLSRRATERELRWRRELVARISHDLRNPLAVFSLALDAIRRSVEAGVMPPTSVLDRGSRAVTRMEHLLGELVDETHVDASDSSSRPPRART